MSSLMATAPKNLIIHAGFHKTGSSTLQVFFTKASQGEIDTNFKFYYPSTGLTQGWMFAHHDLIALLHENPSSTIDNLKSELMERSEDYGVISCEDFCLTRNIQCLKMIVEAFPESRIKILFLVRGHDRWVESMYAEDIKRGRTSEDIWDYYKRKMKNFSFLKQINRIKSILPNTVDISVLNFTPATFIQDVSFEIFGTTLLAELKIWENASLSVPMTYALREAYKSQSYNEENLLTYIDRAFRIDKLLKTPKTYGYLTYEQRVTIFEDHYEESLELSRQYFSINRPFWLPDNKLIYFSTNAHNGVNDIFLRFLERCPVKLV